MLLFSILKLFEETPDAYSEILPIICFSYYLFLPLQWNLPVEFLLILPVSFFVLHRIPTHNFLVSYGSDSYLSYTCHF